MENEIANYLDMLRLDERSSPAGRHWETFRDHIIQRAPQDAKYFPPPLILAAAAESDASKLRRLGDQLAWAQEYGLLPVAFEFLNSLKIEEWDGGSAASWQQSYYFE